MYGLEIEKYTAQQMIQGHVDYVLKLNMLSEMYKRVESMLENYKLRIEKLNIED